LEVEAISALEGQRWLVSWFQLIVDRLAIVNARNISDVFIVGHSLHLFHLVNIQNASIDLIKGIGAKCLVELLAVSGYELDVGRSLLVASLSHWVLLHEQNVEVREVEQQVINLSLEDGPSHDHIHH